MVLLAVAPLGASKHLPMTCRVPPVAVMDWLALPRQVQMIIWVPFVVLLPGSSMHLPEPAPTKVLPLPPPPPPPPPPLKEVNILVKSSSLWLMLEQTGEAPPPGPPGH